MIDLVLVVIYMYELLCGDHHNCWRPAPKCCWWLFWKPRSSHWLKSWKWMHIIYHHRVVHYSYLRLDYHPNHFRKIQHHHHYFIKCFIIEEMHQHHLQQVLWCQQIQLEVLLQLQLFPIHHFHHQHHMILMFVQQLYI